MTINLTKIMGNATDMDKATASRVYFVPLKDIETNKNNYFTVDDSVEALSLNIRTVGILDPLVAVSKNGTTLLISGERRYRALKLLNEHGDHYSFNGTDITGTAPVCYVKDEQQDLLLGAANAHRDMTKEEKNAAIDRMAEILEEEIRENRFIPGGRRKATILAAMTGIKEHYIKDYLASKNKEESGGETPPNEDEEADAFINEMNQEFKALKNSMKKCLKTLEEMDGSLMSAMADDQISELKTIKNDLLAILEYTSEF